MGFTRLDIPTLNKEDKRDYIELSHRYTWCDKHISFKFLKEIGILLTSHPGNRVFLKSSVETHAKTKLWITLAYDNYFNPEEDKKEYDSILPSRDVMNKINSFIMPTYQKWGGVLFPYFWLLRLGISSMQSFPYIYCANGDCIIEKPEGVFILLEKLKEENADIISCGWWDSDRPLFGSTGFIGKSSSLQKLMDHFQAYFIPLKSYEKNCHEFGNCEGRMGRAIKDLELKVVNLENPENEQLHKKGIGDWCKILGFRHIHGEFSYSWKYKDKTPIPEPPELKYYDQRYLPGNDTEFIKKYWENKKFGRNNKNRENAIEK